jgi:hypothetical protein
MDTMMESEKKALMRRFPEISMGSLLPAAAVGPLRNFPSLKRDKVSEFDGLSKERDARKDIPEPCPVPVSSYCKQPS